MPETVFVDPRRTFASRIFCDLVSVNLGASVAALFEGVSIDVDQAWEDFRMDSDLLGVLEAANTQTLFPDTRELRTREVALRALYEGIGLCTSES